MLRDEFYWFKEHQAELAKMYEGKHLIIQDLEVKGVFDSKTLALNFGIQNLDRGKFLVQYCTWNPEILTVKVFSRFLPVGS